MFLDFIHTVVLLTPQICILFKKKGLTCFPANSLFQKLWWHIQILDLISITNSRVPFMEDNVNYTDASNEEFKLYDKIFYELPENFPVFAIS